MMEEQKAHEDQEPNLAFSDDDRIDFEQLRRDLTPAQRLKLEAIQREMNELRKGAAKVEPGSPHEHHKP
jgi:cell fate regulator YaaT (PSP1 superfamily)